MFISPKKKYLHHDTYTGYCGPAKLTPEINHHRKEQPSALSVLCQSHGLSGVWPGLLSCAPDLPSGLACGRALAKDRHCIRSPADLSHRPRQGPTVALGGLGGEGPALSGTGDRPPDLGLKQDPTQAPSSQAEPTGASVEPWMPEVKGDHGLYKGVMGRDREPAAATWHMTQARKGSL